MKATPRSTGCVDHAPSLCTLHPGALAAQSEETGPARTHLCFYQFPLDSLPTLPSQVLMSHINSLSLKSTGI